MIDWRILDCPFYINLEETLFSGQVFHFKRMNGVFAGVLKDEIILLKQFDKKIFYLNTSENVEEILINFFNMNYKPIIPDSNTGLRFLTNDFLPTVFSFICSSNNNITRISGMVRSIYSLGDVVQYDDMVFHKFPSLDKILSSKDKFLKGKFGYRGKFVINAAIYLKKVNKNWENLTYEEAKAELMNITGIGRKVADCICLISLKFFHVVPIDVHILRYSNNYFKCNIKKLNDKNYMALQELWIAKYGKDAGIQQLYVFKKQLDLKNSSF